MSEKRSRTRLDPEARKRQIMAVAAELFVERGFEAVDMAQIAERADVARPTVYKYFPSTEAILGLLLDEAMDEIWAELGPLVACAPELERERAYEAVFAVLLRHPASMKLLHAGGGPIFHRYRRALLYDRLVSSLATHLPPEELPYKRLIESVVLESLAFWAVTDPGIDAAALSRSLAYTLAAGARLQPPPGGA
jgi:AcrR family transcriptional regulator